MITERKNVKYLCGCEFAVFVCPTDRIGKTDCLYHEASEVGVLEVFKNEITRLRLELCQSNLSYALTSSDPETRVLAEQLSNLNS